MASNFTIYPTHLNQENASLYTEQRLKLYQLNVLLYQMYNKIQDNDLHFNSDNASGIVEQLPQVSHTIVEIRAATQQDYAFEDKFRNKAIIVQTRFGQRACELSNCNDKYPRGNTCTITNQPQYFKSGYSDQMACQASCFHTVKNPVVTAPQMYPTFYYKPFQRCLIENPNTKAYFIDDYNRTKEHITINVDTIGTGLTQTNQIYKDLNGNLTPKYMIDTFYCDALHKYVDKTDDNVNQCKDWAGHSVVGFFLGEYNLTFGAYLLDSSFYTHGLSNKFVRTPEVGNVDMSKFKDIPSNSAQFLKQIGHCKPINPHVTLSDLGITAATRHMTWTNEYSAAGNLIEPLLVYTNIPVNGFETTNKKPEIARKINYTTFPNYRNSKQKTPRNLMIEDTGFLIRRTPKVVSLPPIDFLDKNWFQMLMEGLLSAEFLKELVIQEVIFQGIDVVRGLLVKITKRIVPWFVKTLTVMIARQAVVRTIFATTISRMILTLLSETIVGALVSSTLSLVFLGLNLLSFGLALWDPLNMKNELKHETMIQLFNQGFEQNNQMFHDRTPELTIEKFYSIYVSFIAKENDKSQNLLPSTETGLPFLSQTPTEPPPQSSTRKRRNTTNYNSDPLDANELQKQLSTNQKLYGKKPNTNEIVQPKVPQLTGITKLEKINQGNHFLALFWCADYITNLTRNSEGALFDWENDEATPVIDEETLKKMTDNTITDQFINAFLYSDDLQKRVESAERIQNLIRFCLLATISCVAIQAILLACLLTLSLTFLISWHNFYLLHTSKIKQYDTIQKILYNELDRIIY